MGWNNFAPEQVTGGPSVVLETGGRLVVFARHADNAIWHKWQVTRNGEWSDWESLGGSWTSDPAAALNAPGGLYVVARGNDGTLWENWQEHADSDWLGWNNIAPEQVTGGPSVVLETGGRLVVFARHADNAIWHKWQVTRNGEWSDWESLGGSWTSDPAAALNAPGGLYVVARGNDGTLWENWQEHADSDWLGWNNIAPEQVTGGPSVVLETGGRLVVFARHADNAIWHKWQVTRNGEWSDWESLGGSWTSDPAAALNAPGGLYVVARGNDGTLWENWQERADGPWQPPGEENWIAGGQTPTRLSVNNKVEYIIDGEQTLAAVSQALASAQESIHILQLEFEPALTLVFSNPEKPPTLPDDPGHKAQARLADVLATADGHGVKIRVLLDLLMSNNDIGPVVKDLRAAGANSATVRAVSLPEPERLHAKLLVVDGRDAFVLGIPFTQSYFDTDKHFVIEPIRRAGAQPVHDVTVRLQGPSVVDADELFVQIWNHLDAAEFQGRDQITHPGPSRAVFGKSSVQIVRSLPKHHSPIGVPGGETGILESYLRALSNAHSFIYLEEQYFTSRDIVESLKHWLDVRPELQAIVLLNEKPDIPTYRHWQDLRLRQILGYPDRPNLGVFCSWVFNSRRTLGLSRPALRRCYIESKACIVDDVWATVGTANTDGISLNSYYAKGEGRLPFIGSARSVEINATVLDGVAQQPSTGTVREFRSALWERQLGLPSLALAAPPPGGWLSVWTDTARANIERLNAANPTMQGTILPYTGAYFDNAADQLRSIGIDPGPFITTFEKR